MMITHTQGILMVHNSKLGYDFYLRLCLDVQLILNQLLVLQPITVDILFFCFLLLKYHLPIDKLIK